MRNYLQNNKSQASLSPEGVPWSLILENYIFLTANRNKGTITP
jgi:hypothetical protein